MWCQFDSFHTEIKRWITECTHDNVSQADILCWITLSIFHLIPICHFRAVYILTCVLKLILTLIARLARSFFFFILCWLPGCSLWDWPNCISQTYPTLTRKMLGMTMQCYEWWLTRFKDVWGLLYSKPSGLVVRCSRTVNRPLQFGAQGCQTAVCVCVGGGADGQWLIVCLSVFISKG